MIDSCRVLPISYMSQSFFVFAEQNGDFVVEDSDN
jgi:hypothetical protein